MVRHLTLFTNLGLCRLHLSQIVAFVEREHEVIFLKADARLINFIMCRALHVNENEQMMCQCSNGNIQVLVALMNHLVC
jgi:hypothetical protein